MNYRFSNLFFFIFLFVFDFSYSQIDDVGGDLPPTDDPAPPAASIDSFLYFVMILGLAYVFRVYFLKFKSTDY